MNNYYIKNELDQKIVYCESVPEVVENLELICKKLTKKSRSEFMTEMVSLGHGYDDPQGIYFTELMADKFDIGVVSRDGRHKRCNIHEHARNVKYRSVMGD